MPMQAVIACTDAVSRIPVFRPLIGMDKTEIVETARAIGTFETSTLPYLISHCLYSLTSTKCLPWQRWKRCRQKFGFLSAWWKSSGADTNACV